MTATRACVLTLVTLLAASTPAHAEDKAAARQAYAEGTKFYDLNQFAEALEAFKRAYWNYEEPAFIFNIAQCHRALGHKSEALAFYRSYLRKAPEAPNREEVQKITAYLESALAQEKKEKKEQPKQESPQLRPESPPPHPLVATPAPAKAPAKKRTWIWGIVAGAVAAGVAVGVGVGVGAGPHPPTASDGIVKF
jgi:tetratricopeptide (TPR) repeat protein